MMDDDFAVRVAIGQTEIAEACLPSKPSAKASLMCSTSLFLAPLTRTEYASIIVKSGLMLGLFPPQERAA